MTPNEIAQQLAHSCVAVVKHLLPNGKRDGSEWRVGSVHGEPGQSLGIHLSGTKAGVWSDFASGEAGDLLDLWSVVRNIPLAEAIIEAKEYLGIRDNHKLYSFSPKQFDKPHKPQCKPPQSAVLEYLTQERGLTPETIQAFKFGEKDRDIVFPFLRDGELVMCKTMGIDRDENGKKINPPKPTSKNQEPCLFGWHTIPDNARQVIICEGEIDCATWYQLGHPSLSVPYGGGKGAKQQWIEYEFDRLQRFDEILVSMDSDKAGREATLEIVERLGRHRCRVVPELNMKDINDALMAGLTQEMADAVIRDAKTLDPEELRDASNYVDEMINALLPGALPPGLDLPWSKTYNNIRLRDAELTILNGVGGHGKTECIGHLILDALKQEKRVCIASMEMNPGRLLGRIGRQAAGLTAGKLTEPYIRAIAQWFGSKLWIFDLTGTAKTQRLLEVFAYARKRYGIDLFVIDNLAKCGIPETDYDAQKMFVEQLCDFKNKHHCHIILVTHSRKSESEDKPTGKLDVKGTGAITDLADNVFSLWRNKPKQRDMAKLASPQAHGIEDVEAFAAQLEQRSDAILDCCKQRNGDWEGRIHLWFHSESHQFLEYSHLKPVQYVRYSCLDASPEGASQ